MLTGCKPVHIISKYGKGEVGSVKRFINVLAIIFM